MEPLFGSKTEWPTLNAAAVYIYLPRVHIHSPRHRPRVLGMDDCCECRGRHGAFYACLGANGFMFVVLMCINPMFGVIYLFCIAALVAVCVGFAQARCLCETCETRETREHIDVETGPKGRVSLSAPDALDTADAVDPLCLQ